MEKIRRPEYLTQTLRDAKRELERLSDDLQGLEKSNGFDTWFQSAMEKLGPEYRRTYCTACYV